MADKKDLDIDLDDDWGLDDDLDLDMDFDPPSTPLPEGRKAVLAMPKVAATNAFNAIAGPNKRRKLIMDSLPADYSVAASAYDTVTPIGREVYREAKSQLTQTKRDLQRTAKEAMPTLKRYLPESLTKRVETWATKDDDRTGDYVQEDPREAAIMAMMDDTFSSQRRVEENKEKATEKVESDIKDSANAIRMDGLSGIVSNIRGDTANMVAYNQVSDKYRRKMLEVNWRQYYVLTDLLQTTQTSMEKLIPNSDAIVKNTALPDYAKEEFSEIGAALMKRKVIEHLSPANFVRDYAAMLGENAKAAIASAGTSVRDAMSMASMAIPQNDFGDSAPLSPAQERAKTAQSAAGLAGGLLAKKYLNPKVMEVQEKLRKWGDDNPNVSGVGKRVRNFVNTAPEMANDIAKGKGEGIFGTIGSVFGSILPTYSGDVGNVESVTGEALSKVSPWTNRSDLTLNEIIPEWLSTIDQSINRLGGEDAEKRVYDVTANGLVNQSDVNERISGLIRDDETKEYLRSGIDSVVEQVSEGKDLSPEAKETLGRLIDDKIRNVSQFKVSKLADNADDYLKHGSPEAASELQNMFSGINMEGGDSALDVDNLVSDEMHRLRNAVQPLQVAIDEMTALYGRSAVTNSGVFEKENGSVVTNEALTNSYESTEKLTPDTVKTGYRPNAPLETVINGLADTVRKRDERNVTSSAKDLEGAVRDGVLSANQNRPPNLTADELQQVITDGVSSAKLSGVVSTPLTMSDEGNVQSNKTVTEDHRDDILAARFDTLNDTMADVLSGVDFTNELLYHNEDILQPLAAGQKSISGKYADLSENVYTGISKAFLGDQSGTIIDALRKINKERDENAGSSKTMEALVGQLQSTMETNGVKMEVGAILEILQDMATTGFPMYEASGDESDRPRQGYFGKFGQHADKVYQGAKTRAKSFKAGVKSRFNKLRDALPTRGRIFNAIGEGANTVKVGLSSLSDSFQGITDIRDGDGNIVLMGRRLKAGHYFDKDGKVIKTIKDITGAVYDKDGLVLSEEEVLRKKDQFTYYTQKGWKKLSEGIGRTAGRLASTTLGLPTALVDKLLDFKKTALNYVTTSKDIYLSGEDSPRLRRTLMLRDFYIDRNTGKPIKSAKDITGPVYNIHKEMVLSQEELDDPNTKFVDVEGNEFKSLASKVLSRGKVALTFAMKQAKKVKELVTDGLGKVSDGVGAAKDWVVAKISGYGKVGNKAARSIVDKLDQIYRLLDDRLAKADNGGLLPGLPDLSDLGEKDEPIFGDSDGDGDRDGSFKDIFERRKEAREKKKADRAAKTASKKGKGDKESSGGFFGSLFGGLKGLMSSLGGILAGSFATKALGMLGDGLGSIMGKLNPFGSGGKGPKAKGGWISRGAKALWAGTKSVGKLGMKAVGAVGRVGLGAVGTVARQVLWQGARMAGAAALTAVGTLSAPVVLGGMALAAVGYGAYRLLTDKDNGNLTQLRMAMYGTREYEDAKDDEVTKLNQLEQMLLNYTSYSNDGISTVKGVNEEVTMEMAKLFEVETDEPKAVEAFERWLYGRYMPVYLLWTTRARQNAPGVAMSSLDDTSKIEPSVMMKIFEGIKLPADHPAYKNTQSPFGGKGMLDAIGGWFSDDDLLSGSEVKEVEAEKLKALTQLLKQTENKKKRKRGVQTSDDVPINTPWYELQDEKVVRNKDGSVDVGGRHFKTEASYKQAKVAMLKRDALNSDGDLKLTQTIDGDFTSLRDPADLNAVESVRLKAYGLKELAIDKVKLLWKLEEAVLPSIQSTGKSGTININSKELAAKHMTKFGLDPDNSVERARWLSWFESRFVPVLMRYVTSLKQHESNANPLVAIVSTSTPYMLDVALSLVGLRTMFEGNEVSVWSVPVSPFKDLLSVNMSSASTDGNITFLREMQRRAKAMEQTADGDEDIKINKVKHETVKRAAVKQQGTDMSRSIIDRVRNSSTAGAVSFNKPAGTIPIGDMEEAAPDANSTYAKLRLRSNDKESVANLIKQVSKATGVDENLLLTVAMMESSMNPSAGAKTSSAKGLYQFVNSTWKNSLKQHGNKYGIPATAGPMDPVANALLGAEYLRTGAKTVSRVLPQGTKVGPADVYLSHFMGPGGARSFLKRLYSTPDRIAAEDFLKPAAANPGIFTDRGRPLSYREIYEKIQRKARSKFSYVSKYATNPTLDTPALVTSNDDATAVPANVTVSNSTTLPKAVTKPTVNGITSPEQKESIARVRATKDVDKALSKQKVVEAAPTSRGTGSTINADINDVVKATAVTMPKSTDSISRDDYVNKVRNELNGRIAEKEKELSQLKEGMATHHTEANRRSHDLMEQQLTTLQAMAVSLSQINEKTKFMGTEREAAQRERDHIVERQKQPGPTISHDRGPISVSRQRT